MLKKEKRIILTVGNMGDGKNLMTPEEAWYWRRPERDLAEIGFWVQGKEYNAELMNFFIPREFTALAEDAKHWSGFKITFPEQIKGWQYVDNIDTSPFISRWPNMGLIMNSLNGKMTLSEIETHKQTLIHGWLKLICVYLNDSIPQIAYQAQWWENYLHEEMLDYPYIYSQVKREGVKATLQHATDNLNFKRWLKTASCCMELLSDVCPAVPVILKIDRGQNFPHMWAGYQWMKHHRLGSWQKARMAS